MGSLDTFRKDFELAQVAGQYLPSTENMPEGLRAKFAAQDDELKKLRREIEEMRMKSAAGGLDEAVSRAVEVKGVKVLVHRADKLERGQLRTLVDNLKQKLGEGVVVLGSAQPEGKSGDHCRRDAGAGEAHSGGQVSGRGGEDCGRIGRRQAGDCRGRRQRSDAD